MRGTQPHAARLNAFQRVMFQWTQLHPYNATHTYKLAGPLRLDDFADALRQTYRHLGLGIVEVAPDGSTFHHETHDTPEVEVLAGGEDPESCQAAHTTRQLNLPFARPRFRPLRFAVLEAGPQAHFVTVTYDHWVADSVAMRLILRHALGRYLDLEIPANDRTPSLYPATYRTVFGHRVGGLHAAMAGMRWFGQWFRNRSAAQVAYSSITQMAVNYESHWTPPGTAGRLAGFARHLGVTVHDVVLAALARAMAEHLPRKSLSGKGRQLALGSIVDTRPDARDDLSESLGTFLGYYVVRCRPQGGETLGELAQHMAADTRPIKAGRRYLDSLVGMKVISACWPRLSDVVRPRFARRSLPLTAGVSNVLMRDPWMVPDADGPILSYCRAAPTGPNLPLVVAPTTWGQNMNIGFTYRMTGFPRAKIDGVMARFLDEIENPLSSGLQVPAPVRSRRLPHHRAA